MVLMGFLLVRNTQQIPTPASSILFQTKIDWLGPHGQEAPSSTAGLLPVSLRGRCREPIAHHCPIRGGCKHAIKPLTRRSPGTLGAGPTGASEPGKEWTPGLTRRCLSAASPVYLPISVVIAGMPSRSLARPAQGGHGKGED